MTIQSLTSILPSLPSKYDHRTKKSRYCGLHTVNYRVLNFMQKFILDNGISDAFSVNMFSGQNKAISSKYFEKVSVRMSYGRGVVEVNGNRIFFVCENTRTIHHIDDNGVYSTCDYAQNYDVSDVITQVSRVLEVIRRDFVPDPVRYENMQHDWVLEEEFGEKPTIKPINRYHRAVQVKGLGTSKNWVSWTGVYRDRKNRNYSKRVNIGYPKAYKVEIDGVVAWLPHSILGVDSPVFDFSLGRDYRQPITLNIPTWWLKNNITNGQKVSDK